MLHSRRIECRAESRAYIQHENMLGRDNVAAEPRDINCGGSGLLNCAGWLACFPKDSCAGSCIAESAQASPYLQLCLFISWAADERAQDCSGAPCSRFLCLAAVSGEALHAGTAESMLCMQRLSVEHLTQVALAQAQCVC